MAEPDHPTREHTPGISSLPKPWAAAVRLVSTFGLAVFLVLYYVLIMRPQDNKRYEELRSSVESLVQIVEANHTLVTEDLEDRLEAIYIDAVCIDIAEIIVRERGRAPGEQELERLFREALVARTTLFQRLSRRDGRSVSELISNKIQNFDVAEMLAADALERWPEASRNEIIGDLQLTLERHMSFVTSGK